jgi:hypothetical protein
MSWNKAPICGLRADCYYFQTVAGLLMWNTFSGERTGLSFTIVADPRQRSHFRVRGPRDSWPYFIVSDSRLHFLSPPMTHRATVELFDPASTRDSQPMSSQSYVTTDGQSARLSWNKTPIWGIKLDSYYCQTVAGFLMWGALSDESHSQH